MITPFDLSVVGGREDARVDGAECHRPGWLLRRRAAPSSAGSGEIEPAGQEAVELVGVDSVAGYGAVAHLSRKCDLLRVVRRDDDRGRPRCRLGEALPLGGVEFGSVAEHEEAVEEDVPEVAVRGAFPGVKKPRRR